MPDPASAPKPPAAPARPRAALAATVLVALAGCAALSAGGVVAALGGWIAQPALALALRAWQGDAPAARRDWLVDAGALLAAWGGAIAVPALLLAWPVAAVRDGGGFGSALLASAVAGACVLGLWRLWPLWHGLAREGGALPRHWRAVAEREGDDWRGLVVVGCVLAPVAMVLLAAWPGVLDAPSRAIAAVAAAIAWPLLHGLLRRQPAPAPATLRVVDMPVADPAAVAAAARDEDGDADPTRGLYLAARGGRVDRALALLDDGADAHAPPPDGDRDQRTLPVLAAVLPDLRLLRALIAQGVDLNAAHAGTTPLLAATRDSWHGRPEAVMTLLANGADPRATDRDGNTPLHHAARSSDPGVAALLRDAAAEIDARNQDGVTPLGIACAAGNWRLAKFLLERGAKPEPAGGTPALLPAAGGDEDDPAGVQLLLRHKARIDGRDAQSRTALMEAARAGHVEVLQALLDAGADPAARDASGRTPLLDAAAGAHGAAIDLLAPRADAAARDAAGRDAAMLLCLAEAPTPALLKRVLALGAPRDGVDADGRRAADHAAAAGRWALVAELDPAYPLPASVAEVAGDGPIDDRAPLQLLREQLRDGRYDRLDAVVQLVSPADLGALLLADDGAPADATRVAWLLDHGADADARDGDADSPAFALLAQGEAAVPALQALLRHGGAIAGRCSLARFLDACARDDAGARGLEQFALDLLAQGADPFGPAPSGEPPLSLAVRLGWMRLLHALIEAGIDADLRDGRGMTALHLAAALGREPALKALVKAGASPDVRAADGQTPLGVALSAGRRDLADWLDWRGWALPGRPFEDRDLPAAAIAGDADAVRRLLGTGIAVDTVDGQGCTALLRAAGGGHAAVVDVLLGAGADVQRAAHSGATPLSAAVSMRQGAIVDRLLAAGATLEQRLPGEVTVLMLAAALGLPDICARLLSAGANVQAADGQGLTPLHCAALFGFTARDRPRLLALVDTLLLAGAEPDARAAGGVSPLLLLLGARAEPGTACDEEVVLAAVDRLLDEEVELDAQDPRGFGPLHLAALHGLMRATRQLLRAGCDPGLRDALNRTPREIAVMRGFVDVAGEFAPATGAGVSMARFLRDRDG